MEDHTVKEGEERWVRKKARKGHVAEWDTDGSNQDSVSLGISWKALWSRPYNCPN